MKGNLSYWDYLKSAFYNRWNLLGLFTVSSVGVILGIPDIVLPLLGAAELAFLISVAGNPRYQRSIDAGYYEEEKIQSSETSSIKLKRILDSLGTPEENRFNNLRNRCIELRKITHDITKPMVNTTDTDEFRSAGIDKLLWLFLKLLYSKNSLDRFFQTTTREEINASIKYLENKISDFGKKESPHERMLKSLNDNLETSKMRLRNFDSARDNYQFIMLELDRLENKIASILEVSINQQDPEFILQEVDSISQSVQETEKTIGELDFITGLGTEDDQVPSVLQMQVRRTN